MKKYELLLPAKKGAYQIRALVDIPEHGVKAGDIGGWIRGEHNLSQEHNGWVDETSSINDDAVVYDGLIQRDSHLYGTSTLLKGTLVSTRLEGDVRVDGDISIINSIIENGELTGKGNIVDSMLKNITLKDNYAIKNVSVKADDELICYAKQVWSNVGMDIECGKVEKDFEMRDTMGMFQSLNVFETSLLDYVTISNPSLSLTFGDSDVRTGYSKIAGDSNEAVVHIFADVLCMLSSQITGNVVVSGKLKMEKSVIEDFADVNVIGMMKNTRVSGFSVVVSENDDTEIIDHVMNGNMEYRF